jgi:hypothetical protein
MRPAGVPPAPAALVAVAVFVLLALVGCSGHHASPAVRTPTSAEPSTAGVPAGLALTAVPGNVLLDKAQTYQDKHVQGSLYITGSSVTVRDVLVDGSVYVNLTPSGGYVSPVPGDVTVEHVTAANLYTLGFKNLTLDWLELANTRDAPHAQIYSYYDPNSKITYPASGLVLENSWLHGVLPSDRPSHMENLHLGGVQGAVIRNNEFDLRAPDSTTLQSFTANVTLDTTQAGRYNSDVTLTGNVFHGGSYYQLYFAAVGHNVVSDNQFFSDSGIFRAVLYPRSAYPADDQPQGGFPAFTQAGNTLDHKDVTLPAG